MHNIERQIQETRRQLEFLDEYIQWTMRGHLHSGCNCLPDKCKWPNMLENRKLYYEILQSLESQLNKVVDND